MAVEVRGKGPVNLWALPDCRLRVRPLCLLHPRCHTPLPLSPHPSGGSVGPRSPKSLEGLCMRTFCPWGRGEEHEME